MLKHRLITGLILITVLLLVFWLDDRIDRVQLTGFWQDVFSGKDHPPRGLLLFFLGLGVSALAAVELTAIFKAQHIQSKTWLTAMAAILGLVASYSIPSTLGTSGIGMDSGAVTAIAIIATGMILLFVLSLCIFSQHKNVEGVVAAAGAVMFAMVYLGLMFGFLLAIRRWHSGWWIVGIILTTKACDSGAYFTGRAIGKHKLIPWLSPGKTWEGLLGGIVLAMAVGGALAWASRQLPETDHVTIGLGVLAGAIFAVVGQFGDLTMSLLKRGAGIKDSSSLLPGLGGVLDVLDSPLMVAPVAYWLMM